MKTDEQLPVKCFWSDVLVQGGDGNDVWLESIGSGRSSYSVIRFDAHDSARRYPVRFFLGLNPIGRTGPTYRNLAELRRAFLVSLLASRPGLNIASDVYMWCEVNPLTLRRSRAPKVFLFFSIASVVCLWLAWLWAYLPERGGFWSFLGWSMGLLFLLLFAAAFLNSWLFVSADTPKAKNARERLLGREKGDAPQKSRYPERRPIDSRPEGLRIGMDWARLLCESTECAAQCPWESLNGGAWSVLLSERPEFESHCDWGKLNGKNWAKLLVERPEFASNCDWSKLSGKNWASLLVFCPEFAPKCDWKKLSRHDWSALLDEHPEFSVHRPTQGDYT